jgi:hypothetical protein
VSLVFWDDTLTMDQDGDDDYYRVTLISRTHLTADLNFSDSLGNLNLELQSSTGQVLASSTSASADTEHLQLFVPPGTYYFRVYGSGAGNCKRYRLWLVDSTIACGLGAEAALSLPIPFGLRTWQRRRSTTE